MHTARLIQLVPVGATIAILSTFPARAATQTFPTEDPVIRRMNLPVGRIGPIRHRNLLYRFHLPAWSIDHGDFVDRQPWEMPARAPEARLK